MKFHSFNQLPLYTDDFFFREMGSNSSEKAIVIFNPPEATIVSPVFLRSRKSLAEHIDFIRQNNYKKAIIVAEDIHFLSQCPSLESLMIFPAISAENFDYSPLYKLPNLKWLQCETMYGLRAMYDVDEPLKTTSIDYRQIEGLKRLQVGNPEGHLHVRDLENLTALSFYEGGPKSENLRNELPGKSLLSLKLILSPLRSLDGIEEAPLMQRLELSYNRRLTDISALRHLKNSLRYLEIEACGKIQEFSVLAELHCLEYLILKGSNVLPDLAFLKALPKLKVLDVQMDVADGDLSLCTKLPYARVKNRRHFSHKDDELPKNYSDPDYDIPFEVT